jgi:hypothetical protein
MPFHNNSVELAIVTQRNQLEDAVAQQQQDSAHVALNILSVRQLAAPWWALPS